MSDRHHSNIDKIEAHIIISKSIWIYSALGLFVRAVAQLFQYQQNSSVSVDPFRETQRVLALGSGLEQIQWQMAAL